MAGKKNSVKKLNNTLIFIINLLNDNNINRSIVFFITHKVKLILFTLKLQKNNLIFDSRS